MATVGESERALLPFTMLFGIEPENNRLTSEDIKYDPVSQTCPATAEGNLMASSYCTMYSTGSGQVFGRDEDQKSDD